MVSRYIDADAVCELFEPFTDAFTDAEVTSAYVQTLTLLARESNRCKEKGEPMLTNILLGIIILLLADIYYQIKRK